MIILKKVNIKDLWYLWAEIPNFSNPGYNEYQLNRILKIENNLKNGVFYSEDQEGLEPWQRKQIRFQQIGASLDKDGMINPLAVSFWKGYYIINIGNERLCWYRGKNYNGDLLCYVSDDWGFDPKKLNYKKVFVEGIGEC